MSHPVNAWNIGRVAQILGSMLATTSWIGMYWKLNPLPKANHNSPGLISLNIKLPTHNISFYSPHRQLSPSFPYSIRCMEKETHIYVLSYGNKKLKGDAYRRCVSWRRCVYMYVLSYGSKELGYLHRSASGRGTYVRHCYHQLHIPVCSYHLQFEPFIAC